MRRVLRNADQGEVLRFYDEAIRELRSRVAVETARNGSTTYNAHTNRVALAALLDGMKEFNSEMAGRLSAEAKMAQVEGGRSMLKAVSDGFKTHGGQVRQLPVEEALRFAGVVKGRQTSLMSVRASASLSRQLIRSMEKELTMSLLLGEPTSDAIKRVQQTGKMDRWRAERTVRTEMSWAFNGTAADTIEAAAAYEPGLMLRWVEHVDDFTGTAYDKRVGKDSLVMHGQVARPGGVFTMPSDPRIKPKLYGLTWRHPPNRPFDRAVLDPWHESWGTPGYAMINGERVPASRLLKPPTMLEQYETPQDEDEF